MLQIACMRCSQRLALPESYRGKRIVCPKCKGVVLVPGLPQSLGGEAEVQATAAASADRASAPAMIASPSSAPPAPARPNPPSNWLDYLRASRSTVLLSWVIIAFGVGWLLHALNWLPGFAWLWTIGLAVAGLLVLFLGGVNKQTLVAGPYLIILSGFSILRQQGIISWEVEVPSLVIAFGLLLFVVTLAGYNLPDVIEE